MLKKIEDLNNKDKLKLIVIAVLFILTISVLVIPLIDKRKELTADELRDKLNDTAWERRTDKGTEGRLFTMFGDQLIGVLKKSGRLSKDSCWTKYEITDSQTLYVSNYQGDEIKSHAKYSGEHKICLLDNDTLKIDDKEYKKADFEKWKNIGYDHDAYWPR